MSQLKDINTELTAVEDKLYDSISNLSNPSLEISGILTPKMLMKDLKKELQIDVKQISSEALDILVKNDSLSDKEVAIQLLKSLSINSKSSFTRKLAKTMVKKEWWKNH